MHCRNSLCHIGAQTGIFNNLSQCSATAGYQHDNPGGHHALLHKRENLFPAHFPSQNKNRCQKTDSYRYNRLPEENQDCKDSSGHFRCRRNCVNENEYNRKQNREEGRKSGR